MEQLPILILLLYSIPESILLITLACTLYGYQIKENYHRILLLGVSLALLSYIVRALPVELGVNALIQIPLFILLTSLYLKISFVRGFYYILTAFVVLAVLESLVFPAVAFIAERTIKEVIDSILWRLVAGWTVLFIIVLGIWFFQRKRVSIVHITYFLEPRSRSGKMTVIITSLVLIQSFLAVFLVLATLSKNHNVWPVVNNAIFTAITGLLFFTIPIVSLFLVKRMFTLSEQETINQTQEAFLENMDRLFTTIRGQRHDFIHHVQVIYSMLNTDKVKQAIEYMDNMLDEIQEVSNVIKVKDPVLSALINTKAAVAERHNISFGLKLKVNSSKVSLKPYVLVKILGNLIDNALEAVENEVGSQRKVTVIIHNFSPHFIVDIINFRPLIEQDMLLKVFNSGFTTKVGHSGLGLALVKDLVERNGGQIALRSNEIEGTVFSISIPNGK